MRYVSVGAAVLVTSIFAVFSLVMALSLALGGSAISYLPLGVMWGLAIFNLDRWMVSSVNYGVAGDPDSGGLPRKVGAKLALIPRLALAVVLGLAISEPLVLALFDDEIEQEIAAMQREDIEAVEIQKATRRAELEANDPIVGPIAASGVGASPASRLVDDNPVVADLRRQIDDLNEVIADDLAKVEAAQTLYEDEITEGGGGRAAGVGQVALGLRVALEAAQDRLDGHRNDRDGLNIQLAAAISTASGAISSDDNAVQARREAIADEVDAEFASDLAAIAASDGLLAREEALARLVEDNPGLRLRRWLPGLLILIVDSMPAMLKFLSSESVHDRKARYAAGIETINARSEFELELARVNRINVNERRHLDGRELLPQPSAKRHRPSKPPEQSPSRFVTAPVDVAAPPTDPVDFGSPRPIDTDRSTIPAFSNTAIDFSKLEGTNLLIGDMPYRLVQWLARGGTSELYLAMPKRPVSLQEPNQPVVVKIVPKSKIRGTEATIIDQVRHPRVAHLRGFSKLGKEEALALAFRYYPDMSVDRFLFGTGQNPADVAVRDVVRWAGGLIDALEAIWNHGIIHADGKPANLLVEPRTRIYRSGSHRLRRVISSAGSSVRHTRTHLELCTR